MLSSRPLYPRLVLAVSLTAMSAVLLSGCGANSGQRQIALRSALTFSGLTTAPSAAQTTMVVNIGLQTVHISGVSVAGANASDFTQTSSCIGDLAPGASCPVSVVFASSTAGTFAGTLVVSSNAFYGGVIQASLTGTAVVPTPNASFSVTTLNVGSITAGTSGSATVTLTDTGTAALNITSISLSGANANFFGNNTTCGTTLAVNAACTFNISFSPLVTGSYAATLNVPNNSSGAQSVALSGTATGAAITIDTTNAADWKIANGVLNLDFDPTRADIFSLIMTGTTDQLVDVTTFSGSHNAGLYMDNSGFGTPATVPGYANVPATATTPAYLDWWVTYPSSSTNAYTYSEHYVVTANDPGIHLYFVANHSATDIAGGIGQVQWVFRDSLTAFPNTYSVDASVNNPGVTTVPLPSANEDFSTDPGRAVQDATVDLHGLPVPAGFTRSFYTKYDHDGYEYLHKASGLYGSTYGVWTVIPSHESMVGGPTKQDLYFTGNLDMVEAYSNHLDNPLTLATPAGTASSRLFGPYYIRLNRLGTAYNTTGNTLVTPDDLYADALAAGNSFGTFYNNEAQLLSAGYVPSTNRGTVNVTVNNVVGLGSTPTKAAWAVLSDPGKNFQFSSAGAQYWADISTTGKATFSNVIPGTYRLSVYVLGQFGEYRQDGIVVSAGGINNVPAVNFVPENFGTTVFTIGTPDRSSHEFLHGHDSKGFDDKEYWGSFNYWADFAATKGSVVYNATAGPAGPATNDPNQWNYDHWGTFDPGLYDAANDTTDNFTHTIPSYVATLAGASGTNGVTTKLPVWTVHFATPSNVTNYTYAVLSVALACDYGSYVTTLNSTARTWSYRTGVASDCSIRSGLSGYYQWIALQFPVSSLNPAGQDNVLTIGVSQTDGAMDDALRLELTNTPATPATTGWFDYEFVGTSSTSSNIPANDAVPNP
jgi:hypothetical protein